MTDNRFFNTAGPVNCENHYCLPPLTRFNLAEIMVLINQQKYFILHAPRQTGKTSALLALMTHLNQQSDYRCLYANLEVGQTARGDVTEGVRAIIGEIASRADMFLSATKPLEQMDLVMARSSPHQALNSFLSLLSQASPQPLILLLDEIDSLVGDTLLSVLRQLRAGYDKRPATFPQTVILCGVRDIRDYRIYSEQEQLLVQGGSAFNIRAESLRLGNFNQAEVETLYHQHTTETGQPFEPTAIEAAWELTQGQPWLVNALAYETTFKIEAGRDRSQPITAEMFYEAKENLIIRRETHLDQLVHKLSEERVRRVIEPMLKGGELSQQVKPDDIQYVLDLGLIARTGQGLEIANPIYREVIPRELNYVTQIALETHFQPGWYIDQTTGRLDIAKLLTAFQEFFRQNSEHWLGRYDYAEAGPQLLLQAFLQRIVNSGGRVHREYGLGRQRTDLLLVWFDYQREKQQVVMELKIRYQDTEKTIAVGLAQTWAYMDRCGTEEGHLLIFDRRQETPWETKIFRDERTYQGGTITVWGM